MLLFLVPFLAFLPDFLWGLIPLLISASALYFIWSFNRRLALLGETSLFMVMIAGCALVLCISGMVLIEIAGNSAEPSGAVIQLWGTCIFAAGVVAHILGGIISILRYRQASKKLLYISSGFPSEEIMTNTKTYTPIGVVTLILTILVCGLYLAWFFGGNALEPLSLRFIGPYNVIQYLQAAMSVCAFGVTLSYIRQLRTEGKPYGMLLFFASCSCALMLVSSFYPPQTMELISVYCGVASIFCYLVTIIVLVNTGRNNISVPGGAVSEYSKKQ